MTYDSSYKFFVRSPEETIAIGRMIGENVKPGSLIGLYGPLGAGKTELTRGIALALGISDDISSPTFVMEVIYDVKSPRGNTPVRALHHWDLYRITGGTFDSEISDYNGDPTKLVVIEWPERVPSLEGLLAVKVLLDFPTVDTSQQSAEALLESVKSGERIIEVKEIDNPDLRRVLESIRMEENA